MRLLAAREHSRQELRAKLVQRGFAEGDVDGVVGALSERDMVSDERFTEAFVRGRIERGFGPLRIRAELRQRGIESGLIAAYADQGADLWAERLCRAHDKKFGPGRPRDDKDRLRRARFLEYRGFPADLVRRFLFEMSSGP